MRELAQSFGVNPNTMQRALSELERGALLYTERTAGRYVTQDGGLIGQTRDQMADEYIQGFILVMKQLGYDHRGIMAKLAKRLEETDT